MPADRVPVLDVGEVERYETWASYERDEGFSIALGDRRNNEARARRDQPAAIRRVGLEHDPNNYFTTSVAKSPRSVWLAIESISL